MNRTPSQSEADNCGYVVRNEIQIVQPKIIFAVGVFASEYLLRSTRPVGLPIAMKEDGGTIFPLVVDGFETLMMPIYHPAYILRLEGEKAADVKKQLGAWIRDGLRLIKYPKIKERREMI